MGNYFSIWLLLICYCVTSSFANLMDVKKFLKEYNSEGSKLQKEDTIAAWDYETDMRDATKKKTVQLSAKVSKFATKSKDTAKKLLKENSGDVKGSDKRQLELIARTASSENEKDDERSAQLVSNMTDIYSKTRIRRMIKGENVTFQLNSHLLPIMSLVEKDKQNELKWAWEVWRKAVGPKIKPAYEEFVRLSNKGARENGFEDYGDFWRKEYEVNNLEQMLDDILEEMKPLYKKLHAYTRYKLNKIFGDDVVKPDGYLPAQFLSMWAQNWGHLYKLFIPFPKKKVPDVTKKMQSLGWDQKKVLQEAEKFFVSLGLPQMPDSFYEKSMFTRPKDRKVVCHPSSWDIGDGDVRIKMPCMGVSQEDMITVHHEMGHIEYYLLYQNQPVEFRTGANAGFHEAVGDTIALSVMVPEHLESIGLLNNTVGDDEESLNFLMKQALQKVSFIPFAYVVDKWRWSVFAGETKPNDYNKKWWQLRKEYQGVKPPSSRDGPEFFDPGTFFHIAHNTEYLRYFISNVLQFQFHQCLCNAANKTGPLHKCSIHNTKKTAGKKFRNMLQMGKERPWPDALDIVCGSKKMTSEAILDYFAPLERWLDAHRKLNSYTMGWESESSDGGDSSASVEQQQPNNVEQQQQNVNMAPYEQMQSQTMGRPSMGSTMIETDSDSAKTVIQDMPTINE